MNHEYQQTVEAVARAMYPHAFRKWEECQLRADACYPFAGYETEKNEQREKWEPKMEAARARARLAMDVVFEHCGELAKALPYPASEGVWLVIEAMRATPAEVPNVSAQPVEE